MSKLCPKCQYLVGAPLLSSTVLILLGMEFTRAAQDVAGILFHSSIMTSRSCWMLDRWCFSTFRLRMPHMCSIGFRFGDILDHCKAIHWLMARRRLWRNDVVRSYWRTRHPLLRFLCLHEAVTSPFVVAISYPSTTLAIIHCTSATASVELCFSSRWSAMEVRRCIPPCARFIAREDPHSKCILCLGFSHAPEAVYGTSSCKICDDFRLITLRSRLEDYERESSKFSRRASSTSAAPREIRGLS